MSSSDLKYEIVINHIEGGIRHGVFPDGGKIPSENTLARTLNVSVTTIREGIKHLCERGIIVKQQGWRSVVNAKGLLGAPRELRLGWIAKSGFDKMNPVFGETYMSMSRS